MLFEHSDILWFVHNWKHYGYSLEKEFIFNAIYVPFGKVLKKGNRKSWKKRLFDK